MIAIFRPSRRTGGSDPYLTWKTLLFIIGAVIALVGIALEDGRLVGLAIAVLAAGVLLRLLGARGG